MTRDEDIRPALEEAWRDWSELAERLPPELRYSEDEVRVAMARPVPPGWVLDPFDGVQPRGIPDVSLQPGSPDGLQERPFFRVPIGFNSNPGVRLLDGDILTSVQHGAVVAVRVESSERKRFVDHYVVRPIVPPWPGASRRLGARKVGPDWMRKFRAELVRPAVHHSRDELAGWVRQGLIEPPPPDPAVLLEFDVVDGLPDFEPGVRGLSRRPGAPWDGSYP